ncbi:hypothetical protein B0F90DRAFT_1701065 [Multifurca ochricompacta]|uniref:Uncharacterized protein n=1 Tax=Multifurca ochricompacta TaxID=376703 RepID=A0AAD4QQV6_9AGAM|nr:hypothetical protein B0F90DRAFT_1701065 [Multifurca ochricompacta]
MDTKSINHDFTSPHEPGFPSFSSDLTLYLRLSSPVIDHSRSHHAQQASAHLGASSDKENASPIFSSTNGHHIAAQGVALTPSLPASASHSRQLDSVILFGLPPLRNLLGISLCGQSITFDLETLDNDPNSIIELLSATSSDRDKWMIVGAFYRRKGNIHAALTVVTTMVKVLTDLGLKECDMRPAFLMLSSCHTELWKQARSPDGSETELSAAHLDKSRRWLQLVYGPLNPEPTSEGSSEGLDPADIALGQAYDVSISSVHERTASSKSQRTDIEREIQVLRHNQALHVKELANTQQAKRRLEHEATNERARRRRLERVLRDFETNLVKAQRRADEAHALVRMEANMRRRCENTIIEERAKCRTLEEYLQKQAQDAKPLLQELAGLFHKGRGIDKK